MSIDMLYHDGTKPLELVIGSQVVKVNDYHKEEDIIIVEADNLILVMDYNDWFNLYCNTLVRVDWWKED